VRPLSHAWFLAPQQRHPSVLDCWPEFEAALQGKRVALFSDYDGAFCKLSCLPAHAAPGLHLTHPHFRCPGTLAPIVDQPDQAFMSTDMRAALKAVAALFPAAIISGRGLDKVTQFVQLEELYYAGSHGLDIAGPRRCSDSGAPSAGEGSSPHAPPLLHQPVPWAVDLMDSVHDALQAGVGHIDGASVEHNKFCVSVHYRQCPDRWPEVEAAVTAAVERHERLHITRGRKVYEVRPNVEWDKGKALLFLSTELGLGPGDEAAGHALDGGRGEGVCTIYLGDDVSDEDAFRTLAATGLGIGILVTSRVKETAARYTLRDPEEVQAFLWRLVDLGNRRQRAAAAKQTSGQG
jgi:trehalose 6-phosphate phosphatase